LNFGLLIGSGDGRAGGKFPGPLGFPWTETICILNGGVVVHSGILKRIYAVFILFRPRGNRWFGPAPDG